MFKVTIEETKTVTKPGGKEWVIVGSKEVERDDRYRAEPGEPKTRIENVYGYSPEIERQVEEKRTVLTQEVETLDLAKVIRAINNLA